MSKKTISLASNPLAAKPVKPATSETTSAASVSPPSPVTDAAVIKKAAAPEPELSDAEVERFILAGERPPKGYKLTKQAKSSKMRRTDRGERLSIYIPDALAESFRMYCAKENCSKSHAVTIALEKLLGLV